MKRRNFITALSSGSGGMLLTTPLQGSETRNENKNKNLLEEFQKWIRSQGLETHWPEHTF
jgi:hypothetical protein